jgi:hypothetical protein
VLEVCSELRLTFKLVHKRALVAACANLFPTIAMMEHQLHLSWPELARILTLILSLDEAHGPRRCDNPNNITWSFNPALPKVITQLAHPLVAPFDSNDVYVLLRVRLHEELLLSAYGPWCPQQSPDGERTAQINLTVVPTAPTVTTPCVFKLPDRDETLPNETWLRQADMERTKHLGTSFSEHVWGPIDSVDHLPYPDQKALQVDVRLVHIQPAKESGGPRSFCWAQLCTDAASFRTQTDLFQDSTDGVRINGNIVHWNLSAALPFQSDEELTGVSADVIYYTAPDSAQISQSAEDSWMDVNIEFESALELSSHRQEHTVTSVSLGMVWQMSVEGYPPPHGPSTLNCVPCRMTWETAHNR